MDLSALFSVLSIVISQPDIFFSYFPLPGQRSCGERAGQGGQAGRLAGRRRAAGRHPQDRQDDQGEAGHRPRADHRLQHSQRGEGRRQECQDKEVLCLGHSIMRGERLRGSTWTI